MNITDLFTYFEQIDVITICVSLVLFVAASPICRFLSIDNGLATRISLMRVLNALIIIAVLANVFIFHHQQGWVSDITSSLIVMYFSVLLIEVINFFILQRFGRVRTLNDSKSISDTYTSRGLSLLVTVVITLIALITCLRILGFNSLLETGGALGIAGIALAMTQSAWAPDIIAGLIILHSRLCEEGDVIQFNMDGHRYTVSVFRTKLFHTELLDLANNHRLMLRNNKLRDYGIQNLSRFASARGLREKVCFNIGYEHSAEKVTAMIQRAFDELDQHEADGVRERQYPPEVRVFETGDYAVSWAVYYYIKDVRRLLAIKQLVRAYILKESIAIGISLATPDLVSNDITQRLSNEPHDAA